MNKASALVSRKSEFLSVLQNVAKFDTFTIVCFMNIDEWSQSVVYSPLPIDIWNEARLKNFKSVARSRRN